MHLSLAVLDIFHKKCNCLLLPSHSSGKTQPLDFVPFSVFKNRLQDAVSSCAAPGRGKQYDMFDLCAPLRVAYYRRFTVHNFQASFRRAGVCPFDPTNLLSTPRPSISHEKAVIMSPEEHFVAFEKNQEEMRYKILGSDATINRSGFIDTTKWAVQKLLRVQKHWNWLEGNMKLW